MNPTRAWLIAAYCGGVYGGCSQASDAQLRAEEIEAELAAELAAAGEKIGAPGREVPQIDLYTGFKPDPIIVRGELRDAFADMSTISDGCSGYTAEEPDLLVIAHQTFSSLAFELPAGIGLVLKAEESPFVCAAPQAGRQTFTTRFVQGRYKAWFASKVSQAGGRGGLGGQRSRPAQRGRFTLKVSELAAIPRKKPVLAPRAGERCDK